MITLDLVRLWHPCCDYTDDRMTELLAGRPGLTVADSAELPIPAADRIWLLLHLLTPPQTRLYACACVRGTPIGDGRTVWDLLTDERSRAAVEAAERHARGEATDEELRAALDAAHAAAYAASAAYAAYAAAAAAAADTAAYAASAAYAAYADARQWQLAELLRHIDAAGVSA